MEVDPVTLAPSDRLDEGLLEWANCLGVHGLKTVADFLESSQNEVRLNTHPHIPVCCHGLGFNGVIITILSHIKSTNNCKKIMPLLQIYVTVTDLCTSLSQIYDVVESHPIARGRG